MSLCKLAHRIKRMWYFRVLFSSHLSCLTASCEMSCPLSTAVFVVDGSRLRTVREAHVLAQVETSGPTRIRTRAALAKTAVHLRRIMDSKAHTPTVIYNFLFDRMRAVRQDLYTQGIVVRRAHCSTRGLAQ